MVVNAGMDGSRRLGRQGWCTRVSRYRRSSPQNWTRFSPTTSWQRGELDSLTLERQRMVVAAGDGEAVRLASGVDAVKLRCSSGEDEGTKGGGGFQRSFWDGRFGTGGGTLAWQQASHDS
jgi:hypothetical protein